MTAAPQIPAMWPERGPRSMKRRRSDGRYDGACAVSFTPGSRGGHGLIIRLRELIDGQSQDDRRTDDHEGSRGGVCPELATFFLLLIFGRWDLAAILPTAVSKLNVSRRAGGDGDGGGNNVKSFGGFDGDFGS